MGYRHVQRLGIKASLYEMLQILSLTLFEKTQLLQLFSDIPLQISPDADRRDLLATHLDLNKLGRLLHGEAADDGQQK